MAVLDELAARLRAGALDDGGYAYGYREGAAAEATALAALALAAIGEPAPAALAWLARHQREDGSVPVYPDLEGPAWPTSLALLAWQQQSGLGAGYDAQRAAAERYLLASGGEPFDDTNDYYAHDTTLVGWSWVSGSHSWVEPTALAVLALHLSGEGGARVQEGVALLRDRCLPDGGFNYGNTAVFGNPLEAYPAPTGIALLALSRFGHDERVEDCLARTRTWLAAALTEVRAPRSLGWGLVGLRAIGAPPADATSYVEHAAGRDGPADPVHDALFLLALADRFAFDEVLLDEAPGGAPDEAPSEAPGEEPSP